MADPERKPVLNTENSHAINDGFKIVPPDMGMFYGFVMDNLKSAKKNDTLRIPISRMPIEDSLFNFEETSIILHINNTNPIHNEVGFETKLIPSDEKLSEKSVGYYSLEEQGLICQTIVRNSIPKIVIDSEVSKAHLNYHLQIPNNTFGTPFQIDFGYFGSEEWKKDIVADWKQKNPGLPKDSVQQRNFETSLPKRKNLGVKIRTGMLMLQNQESLTNLFNAYVEAYGTVLRSIYYAQRLHSPIIEIKMADPERKPQFNPENPYDIRAWAGVLPTDKKPLIQTNMFEVKAPSDKVGFYEKVRDLAYAYDWNTQTGCARGKAILSDTKINGQIFASETTVLNAWRTHYFNDQFNQYSVGTTLILQPGIPDRLAFYNEFDVKMIASYLTEAGIKAHVSVGEIQQITASKEGVLTSDFAIYIDFGYKNRMAKVQHIKKRISEEKELSTREIEAKIKTEIAIINPDPIIIKTNDLYDSKPWEESSLEGEKLLAENVKYYTNIYTEVFRAIHKIRKIKIPENKILFDFQLKTENFKVISQGNKEQEKKFDSTPESTNNFPNWEGFESIAGQDEAVAEAKKLVAAIKNPEIFKKRGVAAPKGVLLYGPPGTGKTMLAKAIAKESGANFIEVSGADINGKWFGESEQRMQALFDRAKSGGKTIIFFDEFDSLAAPRDEAWEGSKKVLAIFNQNMSGIRESSNVFVIAATNRIEGIDEAAKRSGRFDKIVQMGLPNEKGRSEILKKHMEKAAKTSTESANLFSPYLDFDRITRETNGMSGADLANLVNQTLEVKLSEELEGKTWSPVSTDDLLDMAYKISVTRSEKVVVDFSKKEK